MPRFSGVAAGTVPASTNALVATTLPKVQPDIVDNFFTATPFFWWMREGGRVKTWDGGDSLEIPIMYDENPYARAYRPYEVMDVGPPQGITVATYTLARYRIPLMYDAMTAQANAGDSQVVNLVSALKEQAQLSLTRALNTDVFAESATFTQDSYKINSIHNAIQQTAVACQYSIVGGIKKSSYTWWKNQYKTITSAAGGILSATRELYMQCANGADTPDLGLCDDYTYINLEDKIATNQRFVNPRAVDFGFENVTYKGMTIMYDKSIPDDDHDGDGDGAFMMINSKYCNLYVGSRANFRVVPPEWDVWQDAFVGAILVYLQTAWSNMARQGVLTGGAYALAC